jgi:small-conductance mechanosensitive channel
LEEIIRLVGPERAVEIFGIRMVGISALNGIKLLISIGFVFAVLFLRRFFRVLVTAIFRGRGGERVRFWTRQAGGLITAIILILGFASIWFNDPSRLAMTMGLLTAALAIALQRVITAIAGYFVILRGKTFSVGDRIVMGGVRGDVIALRLTQTVIMEMGQPPPVQSADPAMWVRSRQYTGRVVSVSNANIFDEPVFNYTGEFPYIWEEISIPVQYGADREKAESILLEAAQTHTVKIAQLGSEALREMQRRYFLKLEEMSPKVYYRLTDNWLELTVRFLVEDRGMREVKDAISREMLKNFDASGISVASQTFDIVGMPRLQAEIKGMPEKQ